MDQWRSLWKCNGNGDDETSTGAGKAGWAGLGGCPGRLGEIWGRFEHARSEVRVLQRHVIWKFTAGRVSDVCLHFSQLLRTVGSIEMLYRAAKGHDDRCCRHRVAVRASCMGIGAAAVSHLRLQLAVQV